MPDQTPEDAYRSYFREVELHWSWRREKQIIVSPLEFEAIDRWYRTEIPLAVVLRAIDLFIEKKKKSKRQHSFILTHAEQTVAKVMREYISLHEGEGEPGEPDLVSAKLKTLAAKLEKVKKGFPDLAGLFDSMIRDLGAIDLGEAVQYEDIDAGLARIDRTMTEGFTDRLDAEEKEAIRAEISEILDEEEDPEFFRKMFLDSVRAYFGLPRLTLLG